MSPPRLLSGGGFLELATVGLAHTKGGPRVYYIGLNSVLCTKQLSRMPRFLDISLTDTCVVGNSRAVYGHRGVVLFVNEWLPPGVETLEYNSQEDIRSYGCNEYHREITQPPSETSKKFLSGCGLKLVMEPHQLDRLMWEMVGWCVGCGYLIYRPTPSPLYPPPV